MTPGVMDRLNAALSGRYRIERPLGEGGMATVYLADDLRHKRSVAIKVLKPELAAVVGADRFLAEIEVTANLQHPHILPLFDSGSADGFLFFVMPFIEGETLADRLAREKQLPVEEAVRIARAVGSALSAAHERGVIHRDIKPANILLSRGEPLVADFGISLAVSKSGGTRLTETGLSVGTPYYMSPEQATGDREVTAASDVYSLGCVLYEMLVGEPPHMGSTAQAVLGKIITETPREPSRVRSTVPQNVDSAVMRALEKLPADRFATAGDFGRALSDSGFRHGTSAQSSRPRRSTRVVVAGLAVATATLLGTTLWGMRTGTPPSVVRFDLTLPADVVLFGGSGVNFAISPDGTQIVFTGGSSGETSTQLWHRRLDQLEATPIPGTEQGRNPRFSPDGSSIAFTTGEGLGVLSLTSSAALQLVVEDVAEGNGGLAWSDDGWLYFRRPGAGIWRVPAGSGEAEQVTALGGGELSHAWVEALPGGRGLIFTKDLGGPSSDEIAVLDFGTGETRTLVRGAMARYAQSGHLVYTSGEGTLFAAPFDLRSLEMTGPARTMLQGVRVNAGSASYFAMSETGVLLYQLGGSGAEGALTLIARDATEQILETLVGAIQTPAISPDGSKIAFVRIDDGGPAVWIYDIAQGTSTRLTFEGEYRHPFWSLDSREVGFSLGRGDAPWALHVRPADASSDARVLLADSVLDLRDAEWTNDSSLVVRSGADGQYDIVHAALRPERRLVPLVATDFEEDSPTLSPNGRWLAYVSSESGRNEVYVRPFPGPGGRTTVSIAGGDEPVWATDSELIYVADTEPVGGAFVAATLRTGVGGAATVVARTEIASAAQYMGGGGDVPRYDVSRVDGRLLGVRSFVATTDSPPVVVLNWFEELRSRMAN